ncbi:MAG: hypothetical protein M1269_11785 [Chloroflexi bacterium]|nr:hypothetical protein [Chloroflexota bacterium]
MKEKLTPEEVFKNDKDYLNRPLDFYIGTFPSKGRIKSSGIHDFSNGDLVFHTEKDEIFICGTEKGFEGLIDIFAYLIRRKSTDHIHIEDLQILTSDSMPVTACIFEDDSKEMKDHPDYVPPPTLKPGCMNQVKDAISCIITAIIILLILFGLGYFFSFFFK